MAQSSDPMGLANAGGALGAASSLRQIIMDRELARQQALREQQQQFENSLKLRSQDLLDRQHRDATAEVARGHDLATQEKDFSAGNALGDQIPQNTFLAPNDPAVSLMQKTGRLSLLKPQEERPAVDTGPLLPGDTGGALKQGYLKMASAKQLDTTADNQRQADQLKQQGESQDWRNSIAQQIADLKGSTGPNSSYSLQPEIDPKTGQQTGRFKGYNTKFNRWEPVQGEGPGATKAPPGAAQAANEERAKVEAQDTLSQLDVAIENAKNLVGPGEGRVSNVEQMIGNADPRIQALGVKMKAAKVRVDHAVSGSIRAGASPTLIKLWDNILANNVSYEGLKSGVQAMREVVGGKGAGGGGKISVTAPDGSTHDFANQAQADAFKRLAGMQ